LFNFRNINSGKELQDGDIELKKKYLDIITDMNMDLLEIYLILIMVVMDMEKIMVIQMLIIKKLTLIKKKININNFYNKI
jgi:hypothetical protein